ncbi:hypothetical protein Tco_0743674 [Tanacetum coccineum]
MDVERRFQVTSRWHRKKFNDTTMLPKGDISNRRIRVVPIKVNTFAWKVRTNSLPTRFNISRRGIDIDSISCGNYDLINAVTEFRNGGSGGCVGCLEEGLDLLYIGGEDDVLV